MSKSSCRFVVTKKDDCCYKTTTETVVGLYGVAVPAFPTSSTKDSVHVVRYDDALVTYAYNGTAWIETTNTPITSSVTPGVLVDNGDGTYTWTDTATTFVIDTVDRVLSTVVYSAATQDFTFTWSNGDTTVVDLTGLLNVYSLLGGNNTVVTGNGVSIPWEVNGYGVADNSDGTFTVTLPDGVTTFLIDTNETVTNIVGTQATGKIIGTYTNEAAAVVDIKETITSFASITNGYQFTSEDGTVYPFTFTFDNTTPSAPQLLVNYGATTISSIPLNSYDVNIATTGGFALNPLTDVITITETDGEQHTVNLRYLRSFVTSDDNSVEIIPTTNLDGSTKFDLGVKSLSYEIQLVPYTALAVPTTPGVNIGDSKIVQFQDATIVHYSWDGAVWIQEIRDRWFEDRIVLNTTSFIGTTVTGQTDVELYFNYDGNPFDITSFKINGAELLTSSINVYDGGGAFIYTNALVSLFNTYMSANGYTGVINDDIDNNGGVLFTGLSGGVLIFEIVTDEGGSVNTYTDTSNLITVTTPTDINNPLTGEVETWAIANLTLQQRKNGTQLVYYIAGEGFMQEPDFIWTLNTDLSITLSDKRVYTEKVVYLDTGKGSDITGRRGYFNYPYKSPDSSLANYISGDLLRLHNSDVISSIPLNTINSAITDIRYDLGFGNVFARRLSASSNLLNINLQSDGTLNTLANVLQVNNTADNIVNTQLNNLINNSNFISGKFKKLNFVANSITSTAFAFSYIRFANDSYINFYVKNYILTNYSIPAYVFGIVNLETVANVSNTVIKTKLENVIYNSNFGGVFTWYSTSGTTYTSVNLDCEINNFIQRKDPSYTYVDNFTEPHKNIISYGAGPSGNTFIDCVHNYTISNVDIDFTLARFVNTQVTFNNSKITINVGNAVSRSLSTLVTGRAYLTLTNSELYVKGNFENTQSIWNFLELHNINLVNSKIIFDGNFIGNSNISLKNITGDATSKIEFSGNYHLNSSKFILENVTTNTVVFSNATIITSNASCIDAVTPNQVLITNTITNVLSPNAIITEVGQSIIRNANYK